MSFRISVESVVFRNPGPRCEVLLVKRAADCKVAPNAWNVPAGKVQKLETTSTAVVRETFEETKLNVEIVKLLAESAFEIKIANETAFRNIFTYLTKSTGSTAVELNEEHSEFIWITRDQLELPDYNSLMPHLKNAILAVFQEYDTVST